MNPCFRAKSLSLSARIRLRPTRKALVTASLLAATSCIHAGVTGSGADDLTELSLEELHAISISAASKRAEPLFEAPAAVSVLLPVDLHRLGANSVADSLRLVPGVHVTDQLPGKWSIGIRGGNGVQSTKLLVLVDGRSVYSPFYGGVEWPNADVALDDLARIEVVRGPGATLWGANAVNGVINVISKDARDTQGGVLSVRAGTAEPASAHLRQGGRLGPNTWYRVFVTAHTTDGAAGSLADDPAAGYKDFRIGLRADSALGERFHLTTQAEELASERAFSGNTSTHRVASVLTRLQGREVAGGELQLQLYFDRTRDRSEGSDGGGAQTLPFAIEGDTTNLDLDFSHHVKLGARQDLIWGGGARRTNDVAVSTDNLQIERPRQKSWLFNSFIQDEIALTPEQLRLTLGSKLEHHASVGWELLPNARLAWLPNPRHTFWTAVSRAARAPSRSEREVYLTLAHIPATPQTPAVRVDVSGNPDFESEINTSYEAGWRWRPSARFQTDSTFYYFDYSHVRNLDSSTFLEPGLPPTVVQQYLLNNHARARTAGAELSWTWRASDGWELAGGVSRGVSDTEGLGSNPLVASDYVIPSWLWHLRSWWELPRDWEFSTTLFGVGRSHLIAQEGYLRLDAQFTWRPRPDVELSAGVQNATDHAHRESIVGNLIPNVEVRRNLYGRVQWRF